MKRLLVLLAACGSPSATPHLDGAAQSIDAHKTIDAAPLPDVLLNNDVPAPPYRHTIAIDGTDDFVPAEAFATTSTGYTTLISWDDANVYLGFAGRDLDPSTSDAAQKWVFAYLDTTAGGATTSQTYNTQHATFPSGFGAELYLRWKCDGTLASLETYDGASWSTAATAPKSAQGTQYVEMSIARAALGNPAKLGIVTWMINEASMVESSYAGLYAGNFTDGYAMNLPLTKYLLADFSSPTAPNAQ